MIDPRIAVYALKYDCQLQGFLGAGPGQDGFVLRSDRFSAVKFFDRRERFERELEVYLILSAKGTQCIADHNVPRLLDFDDALLAIEMTIVERPFVLDFAGAKRPHEVPDFDEEIIAEHQERMREMFGGRLDDALHVAAMFRLETGFVLLDIHPGNIAFADGGEEQAGM
jgi:hypothetical protein